MSKSSSLKQKNTGLISLMFAYVLLRKKDVCVFTCLYLGPPKASHLGSGLKTNSLYWELPTCIEGKRERVEIRRRGGKNSFTSCEK